MIKSDSHTSSSLQNVPLTRQ